MIIEKFGADWCTPCKQIENTLATLAENNKMTLVEYNTDNDKDMELAREKNVKSIPTVIILDEQGKELGRRVGVCTLLEYQEWLNKLI